MHKRVPGEPYTVRCNMCGRRLTKTDIKYYTNTCNNCEGVLLITLNKEEDTPWWICKLMCYYQRLISCIRR